jgi:hypothetical protein
MLHSVPIAVFFTLILLFAIATVQSTSLALVILIAIAVTYLAMAPPPAQCLPSTKTTQALPRRAAPPVANEEPPTVSIGDSEPLAPPTAANDKPALEEEISPETPALVRETSELPSKPVNTTAESQWLPSQQQETFRDKQRSDFHLHRSLRRDVEWHDKWTEDDSKRYERQRRNVEFKIAKNLRPDKYMIVDRAAKMSDTLESDYPFASIHSENNVLHTARFRSRIGGQWPGPDSGEMIESLRSN